MRSCAAVGVACLVFGAAAHGIRVGALECCWGGTDRDGYRARMTCVSLVMYLNRRSWVYWGCRCASVQCIHASCMGLFHFNSFQFHEMASSPSWSRRSTSLKFGLVCVSVWTRLFLMSCENPMARASGQSGSRLRGCGQMLRVGHSRHADVHSW